jgi:uncharacterized membrane-anchored protein
VNTGRSLFSKADRAKGPARRTVHRQKEESFMSKVVFFASMFIWAVVILVSSMIEPEAFKNIILVLGGGAVFHLILLGSQVVKRK